MRKNKDKESKSRRVLSEMMVKAMTVKGHHDLKRMHRNTIDARSKNEKLLMHILDVNKYSVYGMKYGFEDIKSAEEYKKKLPYTTFDDYEDYIVQMIDNDKKSLITSLKLVGYAQSSGSVGNRKFVPITQPEVNVYTRYTVTRMLALADDYHKKNRKKGNGASGDMKYFRGMFTCPSFDDRFPNGMLCSNIADVAAKQLGFIYPYILNTPFRKQFTEQEVDSKYINLRFSLEEKDTMYMFCVFFREITSYIDFLENNWETMVDDIEHGTVSEISHATPEALKKLSKVLKPNPERAAELRTEFEKGFDETIIKRIWPNMSVICGIGTSTFEPFAELARKYTKGIPFDFSIYGASEGLFAAVDELDSGKQLLLIDSCYYEFIPQDTDDESITLSVDELEIGKEYEIVITNQAGLYRYRCGDVIKVVDKMNDCPYIQFSLRKGQLLNITGEKTTEEHMAAVVNLLKEEAGCEIINWTVYNDLDKHPYHYVLLLENDSGIDMKKYEDFAHQKLCEVNPRYAYFTAISGMGRMTVENQEPGTQKAWAAMQISKGVSSAQVKPVRILDTPVKEEFFKNRIKH